LLALANIVVAPMLAILGIGCFYDESTGDESTGDAEEAGN
jgi:hypothetical protein